MLAYRRVPFPLSCTGRPLPRQVIPGRGVQELRGYSFKKSAKFAKLEMRRKDKKKKNELVKAGKAKEEDRMLHLRDILAMGSTKATMLLSESKAEDISLQKRNLTKGKAPAAEGAEEGTQLPKKGRSHVNWERDPLKVFIIHPVLPDTKLEGWSASTPDFRLQEAIGLVEACNWQPTTGIVTNLHRVSPSTFLGSGKVAEVEKQIGEAGANIVFIDAFLTPAQQRNLQDAWGVTRDIRVIDRLAVILEIFSERAQTHESKLQVELAWLQYQRAYLIGKHNSEFTGQQQKGGHGFLSGAGETQLETDRRRLDNEEAKVRKSLEKVRRTRGLQRDYRRKFENLPLISIVGYTNAGKSALVNSICNTELESQDMLFTSLSPHIRSHVTPQGLKMMILDSVGFISQLPHQLIEAFKATLEEINESSLLVHVRDVSNPEFEYHKSNVLKVLEELDLQPKLLENQIEVWNKIDLLDKATLKEKLAQSTPNVFPISALDGTGVDKLMMAIEKRIRRATGRKTYELVIDASDLDQIGYLYRNAQVVTRTDDHLHTTLHVNFDPVAFVHYTREFKPAEMRELASQAKRRAPNDLQKVQMTVAQQELIGAKAAKTAPKTKKPRAPKEAKVKVKPRTKAKPEEAQPAL